MAGDDKIGHHTRFSLGLPNVATKNDKYSFFKYFIDAYTSKDCCNEDFAEYFQKI